MGGSGGFPCRRHDGAVEDTDLGLSLSECGWLGRIFWLTGRPWIPSPKINVFFYVVWWEQEAYSRLEGAVVPSGWIRRGLGVGGQQYGAEVVGGVF